MALSFWDSVLWAQHSLSWAGSQPTQAWSTGQRQKMRRWEETFRSPATCAVPQAKLILCPGLTSTKPLEILWGPKGKWDSLPNMMFPWKPSKSTSVGLGKGGSSRSWTWEVAARSNCEFGACQSRLVTDCSLSHPASTAMVSLCCDWQGLGWGSAFYWASSLGWWPFWKEGTCSGWAGRGTGEHKEAQKKVFQHPFLPFAQVRNEAVEKRADEDTIRREEKNINWLYSRVWAIWKTGND